MAATHHTFSVAAVMVIAGVIPVTLLAKEHKAIYYANAREMSQGKWLVVKNGNAPWIGSKFLGKIKLEADGLRSSSTIYTRR